MKAAKRLIQSMLGQLGYRLVRVGDVPNLALEAALERVVSRDMPINTIIDIGASNGSWSKRVHSFYPDADYLLIDPNPVHEMALDAYSAAHPNVQYELVAAGDIEGTIYFDMSEPFGGIATQHKTEGFVSVPIQTVDNLVNKYDLQPPYLFKMDTHGFEVPILNGAAATLEQTSLIVVEVYNFHIHHDALLFYQMCEFLSRRGFHMIDLCDPLFRQYDNAFWQADFFFIRRDRPEFTHMGYQ